MTNIVAAVKKRASYGESGKRLQDATHSGMLKRAKERYERVLAGPNESRTK